MSIDENISASLQHDDFIPSSPDYCQGDGYAAYQQEKELSDCPYPAHTKESHDWIKEWAVAAEEARNNWAQKADSAVAAIQFSLSDSEGHVFLNLWNEGDFDSIREEWPEVPEAVFIGADPLYGKR